MTLWVVRLCFALLILGIAFFKRDYGYIKVMCAVVLLADEGWVALHYVAHLRVPGPFGVGPFGVRL